MLVLLRTYLVGEDRKFELYGNADGGNDVLKVLQYAYRSLDPEEKTCHWVCLGTVDITDYIEGQNNPALIYTQHYKQNDISSIKDLCRKLAKK